MGQSTGLVALLDTLTLPETLTILVVALVVLGPEKLPGMARTAGEWMNKLKRMSANLQAEVRDVMDDPTMQPLRELGEFAAQPKKKLAELALAAEAEAEAEAGQQISSRDAAEAAADPVFEEGANDAVVPVAVAPEPPAKVVATGPAHPMLAQSPEPQQPAEGQPDEPAHVVDP